MRRLVQLCSSLMLVAIGAFGQSAQTRVVGTIVSASGPNPSGTLTLSWNRYQNDAVPRQTIAAGVRVVTITLGVVDVSVFPTAAMLPVGCFTAAYKLNGVNSTRYWTVPVASGTVTLNTVEGNIPCPPVQGQSVAPGQITDGGASVGQVLTWNGTFWYPGTGGGSGGSPGGTNGQLQYNNLGAFGGFTPGGDCVLVRPSFICTKTNGVAFAPSATIDTTNASNITSGTLGVAEGGTGSAALTPGSVPYIGALGVYSQDVGMFAYDATSHRLCIGCSTWGSADEKLRLVGASTAVLSITAAPGNYYSDLVIASGGGGSGGDHAIVTFNQGATPKWLEAGVWNGDAKWSVREVAASYAARLLLQSTSGNFSVGNPGSESDNNSKFSVLSSGSARTVLIQDQTPFTGVTQIGVAAGAAQGTANLMLMQGPTYQGIWDRDGQYSTGVIGGDRKSSMDAVNGVILTNDVAVAWRSTGSLDTGVVDLGISRLGAGVLAIGNGTAGQYGDIRLRDETVRSITGSGAFDYGSATGTRPNLTGLSAAIPATCSVGQTYFKTDAVAGANLFGCTSANTWTVQGSGGGGGSGPTLQTNSVSNASQTTLNLLNSAATNGLTLTFANASGGNVQLGYTGTLNNAGITNPATTVNGATCTLGSTCTLSLASSNFANQGSTTTVLHGNAAGNPGWGAVSLTADVTGTLPVANGGTGAGAFTAGSVVYAGASGVYTQDNARFFWDNTNHRLGIANNSPAYPLDVTGSIRSSANFIVTSQAEPTCDSGGEGKINYLRGGSGANSKLRICLILADDSFAWIPII